MIKVGIIGGSGYTGGELIRLLAGHPEVEIDFVFSRTRAGKAVQTAHPDLTGVLELDFSGEVNTDCDLIFLCLGHGKSKAFLERYKLADHTRIIDLSTDFRHSDNTVYQDRNFVYGLPELFKEQIVSARSIANPGCFATALQLALLPLADKQLLTHSVHCNGITGSTGAGVGLSDTSHFSWRNNNISWYKPFNHQHLQEVNQTLDRLQQNREPLVFLPQRGNFSRGIFITAYTQFTDSLEVAQALYEDYYKMAPFTAMASQPINLKQVVNTNFCHLHLHKHGDLLLITSAIDNLLKGASGQAVQNMNLIFGLPEDTGLQLKAIGF